MENVYRAMTKQNENKPKTGDIRVCRIDDVFHVQNYVKGWFWFLNSWETITCFTDKDQAVNKAEKLVSEKHLPKEEVIWSER